MARSLMDIKQVAEYLNISHHTLYKLLSQKLVPAAKIGGSWRFSADVLDDCVRKQAEENLRKETRRNRLNGPPACSLCSDS